MLQCFCRLNPTNLITSCVYVAIWILGILILNPTYIVTICSYFILWILVILAQIVFCVTPCYFLAALVAVFAMIIRLQRLMLQYMIPLLLPALSLTHNIFKVFAVLAIDTVIMSPNKMVFGVLATWDTLACTPTPLGSCVLATHDIMLRGLFMFIPHMLGGQPGIEPTFGQQLIMVYMPRVVVIVDWLEPVLFILFLVAIMYWTITVRVGSLSGHNHGKLPFRPCNHLQPVDFSIFIRLLNGKTVSKVGNVTS